MRTIQSIVPPVVVLLHIVTLSYLTCREKDMQSLYRMEEYKLDASKFASNASKAVLDAIETAKGARPR